MKLHLAFAIGFILSMTSCVTAPQPKPASEFLLTSDKGVVQSLADVRTALTEKKYKIHQENPEVGILITQPRLFSYSHGGSKASARQTVQLRQEGGSVKLRLLYECENQQQEFGPCYTNDMDAITKIQRLDKVTVDLMRSALQKKPGVNSDKDPKSSSWGTEIK